MVSQIQEREFELSEPNFASSSITTPAQGYPRLALLFDGAAGSRALSVETSRFAEYANRQTARIVMSFERPGNA